jgi:hypothetical protein
MSRRTKQKRGHIDNIITNITDPVQKLWWRRLKSLKQKLRREKEEVK